MTFPPKHNKKSLSIDVASSDQDTKIATIRLWRFRLVIISLLSLIFMMEEVVLPATRRPPRLDYGDKLVPGQYLEYRWV